MIPETISGEIETDCQFKKCFIPRKNNLFFLLLITVVLFVTGEFTGLKDFLSISLIFRLKLCKVSSSITQCQNFISNEIKLYHIINVSQFPSKCKHVLINL